MSKTKNNDIYQLLCLGLDIMNTFSPLKKILSSLFPVWVKGSDLKSHALLGLMYMR